jgi:hypothetical protein
MKHVLTFTLAIAAGFFCTLLGMAVSSEIVPSTEMPDNAFPYFIGAAFSFYIGVLWGKK